MQYLSLQGGSSLSIELHDTHCGRVCSWPLSSWTLDRPSLGNLCWFSRDVPDVNANDEMRVSLFWRTWAPCGSGDADRKEVQFSLIQDSDQVCGMGSREAGLRGLWIWEVLGCGSLPCVNQCTHHNINLNHSSCPWVAPVPLRGPAFIAKESVQMYTATLGLCNPQHTTHKPGRNSAAHPGASHLSWGILSQMSTRRRRRV